MSLAAQRYLVELGPAFLPEPHYLHVFEGGAAAGGVDHEWSPDKTRALRFRSRAEAEAFAHDHLEEDTVVTGHPAAELVAAPHEDLEHEAKGLSA